jgi:TolB-like protein/Tfp pilus assembly protein PilF/tRNA A-37 threonylcarbamoyl transferase component Bud32
MGYYERLSPILFRTSCSRDQINGRKFKVLPSADFLESLSRALGDSYTVERELLGGAMSRVFVAYDRALGRRVAVKVLSREVAAEVKTERFRLEIQLAARLQHPHIVPLLQSGELSGILYFTMPFIEGESLRARLAREGALPMPDGLRILRHVASALSYAHRQGVVHRDIKPDNVLIADEFALVTDFGVARALSASTTSGDDRLTSSGVALGTPAYMSPEQALAEPDIDHRADIYAFGVMAYEVLTGAPPFGGKSAQATLAAHVIQPPENILAKRPDVPPIIAETVMKCLEKKPADRPQNASELVPVLDSVATGSPTATSALIVPSAPGRRTRSWILAGVAALLLIPAGYLAVTRSGSRDAAGAAFTSVAVLPLENLGGDQTDEYFSDGMTDELANALGKLPGVRVASRTSAYAFKGKTLDPAEIGRRLNVKTFISGQVRRVGPRLRVYAELVNVEDGSSLWSERYERQASDIFSVQDDIARQIAQALQVRLRGPTAQTFASESRGTENLAAFEAQLRARYFLNRRGAENLRLAVAYFDSAIARDPRYARAHSGRATAYALLPEYTDSPPENASALTHKAAATALSIDSTLAEAYTAIGLSEVHDWKFAEAYVAYRKALALDPQFPTAHQWYGELLFHTGRTDSSLAQIRTAIELDPLAPINAAAIGYALVVSGRFDEAIAELKKGIELTPALGLHHAMLGDAYLQSGRVALAIPEFETSIRLDPELELRKGFLAHAYGLSGQTDKATAIIAQLEERQKARGGVGVALTVAYLGLRDREKALTALEQAVAEHDISLVTSTSLVPDRLLDPLRGDPRFKAILRKMNLDQYAAGMQRR